MVGIQEARTKEGLIFGKGPYYRLCSGHQGGHHGVELWISKTQPVGFIGSRPVLINRSDVTVLWKDPRRLLVHIETEVTALYVAVLHCPQSGQGVDTRESWWLETTELLSLHVDPMKLFVLGDFNATSGPTDGVVVFEADDVTSPNTDCFRASLEALQLCLPATALAHEGPFHTWVSPDGTIEKRIHFIAIPQSFCHCVAASATLDDVDLGNGAHDHCAVGLSLQHSLHTRPVLRRRKRPQIDRAAIKHIDRNIISSAIASSSAPNWQQDIETDVAHFIATALQLLTTHCKPSAPEAKKPFFDEALWNLRTEKNSSRRTLKRVCKAYRSEVLRTYFNAWTLSQGSTTICMPLSIGTTGSRYNATPFLQPVSSTTRTLIPSRVFELPRRRMFNSMLINCIQERVQLTYLLDSDPVSGRRTCANEKVQAFRMCWMRKDDHAERRKKQLTGGLHSSVTWKVAPRWIWPNRDSFGLRALPKSYPRN